MNVHFDARERKRAVAAVAAVAVAVAILLSYTVLSTRKATDDVVANVSSVYLGELSKQMAFRFDASVEGKFGQMDAVATGLAAAGPRSRGEAAAYLTAQARGDDYSFLALKMDDGGYVVADGATRFCDGGDRTLPAYVDGRRTVALCDGLIVLEEEMDPVGLGDGRAVAVVCGFSAKGVGDRLDLTLFDGFSRTVVIDRNGVCVVSDGGSELEPGDSLFDRLSVRVSFPGGDEAGIRASLAHGDAALVPITVDGRDEYLYFRPLDQAEWYICTVMPCSAVEGDIGDLSGTITVNATIVCGVLLLFALLAFLVYYRLARKGTRLLAEEKDRAERAFAEAQQASLAKTDFLSRMSHEIRTPMNGIMGMTAIALESIGDDDKVRECLEKVTLSSEHLLSLINDILDMSKIESGKIEIKCEAFDLATFIGSLAAVFRTQAAERGISFDAVVEGSVPESVVGDPLRLNQVVYNLMGNAFKFTPEGGSVTLRIERLEDGEDGRLWLRFAVDDTGCGIEPEYLDKIFGSFEQGDASVARLHGGTGLGLAITKRFVELMGGRIRVASVAGHGSSFAVDVPFGEAGDEREVVCEPVETRSAAPVACQAGSYDFSGARVLVVEDNPLNQEIAVELMNMAGASVDTASTGREAVDAFAASEAGWFDLVLMDVQMPDMDGYEAARAIRAMDRSDARTVVILAMTANAFTEDEERSLASGMDGHLSKPLDIRSVYATINGFLGKRREGR
ncbi:hybrid sensor histidine kinase/response regulator [Gordonibacter sp. 28C]|uniref:ATP-binding protein n=1 Tax=Gordonibacter sp. 28C TaxID=2078569 RepID=UPI000DF82CF5|nr:ATP-binding protein [Gordonibacter sp. 28C]RDB61303.1 hybrid sensor histidine kinase/response regulator [Gordonibacter sp. 28C]